MVLEARPLRRSVMAFMAPTMAVSASSGSGRGRGSLSSWKGRWAYSTSSSSGWVGALAPEASLVSMAGEETVSLSMVGSRLGKAATAAAFVATEKPGAGRAGTPQDGPLRLTPRGGQGAGAERRTATPALLLRDAKAEGRRKRVGGRRCGLGPFRAAVARSKKAGARPLRDSREPCSTEAPSPAIVIRALAALRRPA